MTGSDNFPPGRALRPEVRMNKEQEEALGVTHCDNCGGTDDVRTVYYDENEHVPYRRRTVTVELTPEQVAQLKPRVVGHSSGADVREEILTCWVENEGGRDG